MADPEHLVSGIVPSLADPPGVDLSGDILRALAGKRRDCGSPALSSIAVAFRAGSKPAVGIAGVIKPIAQSPCIRAAFKRLARVMERNHHPLLLAKAACDPRHLGVHTAPVDIRIELPLKIAGIQPGKTRRCRSISSPLKAVTNKAGIRSSRSSAAQGDQCAAICETFGRSGVGGGATGAKGQAGKEEYSKRHGKPETSRVRGQFPVMLAALLIAACKMPPDQRPSIPLGDAARGEEAYIRAGCGACHTLAGLSWPRGKVGPPLVGLADRAVIAGSLPNRPDLLAAFIRDAPALVPGSTMPPMPVSQGEANDIATLLYQQDGG